MSANSLLLIAVLLSVVPQNPAEDPMTDTQTNSTGPVQSTAQAGGVTAGNIGTVNQMLPTLVRGPLLEQFKQLFAEGAELRLELFGGGLNDEQYQQRLDASGAWADKVYRWLWDQFGAYAAQRFNFRTSPAVSYNGGPQDAALNQAWTNRNMAMTAWLQNLDLLMREPSLYPDH